MSKRLADRIDRLAQMLDEGDSIRIVLADFAKPKKSSQTTAPTAPDTSEPSASAVGSAPAPAPPTSPAPPEPRCPDCGAIERPYRDAFVCMSCGTSRDVGDQ